MGEQKKIPFREVLKAGWRPYLELAGFLRPYRKRFALGILAGIGYALVNGAVPIVIYLVASQVFGATGGKIIKLPAPLLSLQEKIGMPDWLSLHPGLAGVLAGCVLIPLTMIIRSLLSYSNAYCIAWVSFKMLRDLRSALFDRIVTQSLDFFNREKTGRLISRIANETRVAQAAFISVAADLFRDPISLVVGICALLYLDWKFCLAALILFPVCIVPVVIVGKKVRKAGKAEEEQAGAMTVILHESLTGIRVIKSFARESYQSAQFGKAGDEQFRHSIRVRKTMDVVQPLIEVVSAFGIALALLYIFFFQVEVAKIIALLMGTFLLYEPFKRLSRIHVTLQKALSSSTAIFDLLRQEPSVKDAPNAVTLESCKGHIAFKDVTFAYGEGKPAISNISLDIQPGKKYALVGSSGAGKSTILSLLLRFYDPQGGAIEIDGKDLRALTQQSLREHMGIVTQETFLFHDTIYENIRYGRLNASEAEIYAAAKLAYAHDFIEAQPEGYKTIVGDKGCLLSGGQQQRLSIARALLKNAPILLLDEATSALDSESEQMIQAALDRLAQGRTVIAIAHRLSTILKSDQIVVMEHGRIVETGTHKQLLETSTQYRRLYEFQFHHSSELVPKELTPA